MLKNIFLKWMLLGISLVTGGCVSAYPFKTGEKSSIVTLLQPGGAAFCKAGRVYHLPRVEGTDTVLVPVDERITIGPFLMFQGFKMVHYCQPSLSFRPRAEEKYFLHAYVRDEKCYVELVREDRTSRTGVSIEPTAGPRECSLQ